MGAQICDDCGLPEEIHVCDEITREQQKLGLSHDGNDLARLVANLKEEARKTNRSR